VGARASAAGRHRCRSRVRDMTSRQGGARGRGGARSLETRRTQWGRRRARAGGGALADARQGEVAGRRLRGAHAGRVQAGVRERGARARAAPAGQGARERGQLHAARLAQVRDRGARARRRGRGAPPPPARPPSLTGARPPAHPPCLENPHTGATARWGTKLQWQAPRRARRLDARHRAEPGRSGFCCRRRAGAGRAQRACGKRGAPMAWPGCARAAARPLCLWRTESK
jgi:hypothetical protein